MPPCSPTCITFWLVFRIVVGIATLLLLALAGLSMREPIAQMGANVPFYPESVPPWLAVMDVDRAVALEQAGDRAKDRLAGLQRRLDESERLRLQAEGDLQQALTALSSGGRGMPVPASAAAGPAAASRQPTPEAAAAAVGREPRLPRPDRARARRRAGRVAEAGSRRDTEPEPVVAEAERSPIGHRPSRSSCPSRRCPSRRPRSTRRRSTPGRPSPSLEPEAISVVADDVTVTATPVEAEHDDGGWPEVVVLPEPAARTSGRGGWRRVRRFRCGRSGCAQPARRARGRCHPPRMIRPTCGLGSPGRPP